MKVFRNLSFIHLCLTILMLLILLIPWYQLGIEFPNFVAGGKIVINSKYIVVGFFYIIFLIFQIWEMHLNAPKTKEEKMLVSLKETSDLILIQGMLILLAYNGFLSIMIPIFIVIKDFMVRFIKSWSVDNGKIIEKSFLGILEKIFLHIGIVLLLFYNLPFELWNVFLADALVIIATILSVVNGCLYYFKAKKFVMSKK